MEPGRTIVWCAVGGRWGGMVVWNEWSDVSDVSCMGVVGGANGGWRVVWSASWYGVVRAGVVR